MYRAEKKRKRLTQLVAQRQRLGPSGRNQGPDGVDLERGEPVRRKSSSCCCHPVDRYRQRKIAGTLNELTMDIDEVEQLRIMYSQFFSHNSAVQEELELHRNGHRDEIDKLLRRRYEEARQGPGQKEPKLAGSKLAMMYQQEESMNPLGQGHIGRLHSWWNRQILEGG